MSCAQDFEHNISAKKVQLIHRFFLCQIFVSLPHQRGTAVAFDCDAFFDGVSTETPGFQHGCCGI